MKRSAVAAIVVALIAIAGSQLSLPASAVAGTVGTDRNEVRAEFLDIAGRVFQPGDAVAIRWELSGPGVKYFQSHPWGECELFFSTDGGANWSRITPQLSVSRRDYDWIVPDVATRNARFGLQIGIEGDGEFHEFSSKKFIIREARGPGRVRLSPPSPGQLRGGSELELEWTSTVADLEKFEVLISSDRGAHLFSVGETTGNRFSYSIPEEYEGFLTVQVLAHRHGNSPVRSAIDDRSTFRVQAGTSAKR
jgi:hypothetical protein